MDTWLGRVLEERRRWGVKEGKENAKKPRRVATWRGFNVCCSRGGHTSKGEFGHAGQTVPS